MNDVALHQHGKTEHTHAWANVPHMHLLRAVCSRPECKDFGTHNIHADAHDHRQEARERAAQEGIGY
jgi:hypothetical protein